MSSHNYPLYGFTESRTLKAYLFLIKKKKKNTHPETKKENKNHKESNQDLYVGVYVPFLIMCMYRGVCVRVNIYDIVLV